MVTSNPAFALALGQFVDTMGKGAAVSAGAPALLLIELAHDLSQGGGD